MSEGAAREAWTVLSEVELFQIEGRLLVSRQHLRLPDGAEVADYLRITTPPFANIFAIAEDGRILCERQYKHGVGREILTLPAGSVDPGESPLAGARRELLEETGFVSDDWTFLATAQTHANAGGSAAHMFLARNCRKVAEPNSGDLEEMQIEHLSFQEVFDALQKGQMPLVPDNATILHALMVLGRL